MARADFHATAQLSAYMGFILYETNYKAFVRAFIYIICTSHRLEATQRVRRADKRIIL